MKLIAAGTLALAMMADVTNPIQALAWGDEGHQIVALIAQSFLDSDVQKRVTALLAADTDDLTAHDIANAATWADKYRDANFEGSRAKTRQWHFTDIEIAAPDLHKACFNHPALPTGTAASNGPAADCVVDKIDQFAAELADPKTDPEEQTVALKFLLHFVGDLHQPLHSSDDNDRGGNGKKVSANGFKGGNLHHYWDTEFVSLLETDAKSIASDLIGHISKEQEKKWRSGSPADWAVEAFEVAKADVYGRLPEPSGRNTYQLTDEYITTATDDVAQQLSKAGVRLAFVLNNALRKQ
jgi:S1/P1 Nuclease